MKVLCYHELENMWGVNQEFEFLWAYQENVHLRNIFILVRSVQRKPQAKGGNDVEIGNNLNIDQFLSLDAFITIRRFVQYVKKIKKFKENKKRR